MQGKVMNHSSPVYIFLSLFTMRLKPSSIWKCPLPKITINLKSTVLAKTLFSNYELCIIIKGSTNDRG